MDVFLRLRPLADDEKSADGFEVKARDNAQNPTTLSIAHQRNKTCEFQFSRVFNTPTTQKQLFEHTAKDLVLSTVAGKSGLLFAYGITNSGKTYTIQGNSDNPGILPQAVHTLFKELHTQSASQQQDNDEKQAESSGSSKADFERWGFYPSVSLMEIYNEKIVDLMRPEDHKDAGFKVNGDGNSNNNNDAGNDNNNNNNNNNNSNSSSHDKYFNPFLARRRHIIRRTRCGKVYVTGLTQIPVFNPEQCIDVVQKGLQRRATSFTGSNVDSSRSHCIFSLKLVAFPSNDADGWSCTYDTVSGIAERSGRLLSKLVLVDLAGAERTKKTHNRDGRLKETAAINNSLMTLGRCLQTMRHNDVLRAKHTRRAANNSNSAGKEPVLQVVPFRDSKITRLFQSWFSGKDGNVRMIATAHTAVSEVDETINCLQYASIASRVQVRSAVDTQTPKSVFVYQEKKRQTLKKRREEAEKLRKAEVERKRARSAKRRKRSQKQRRPSKQVEPVSFADNAFVSPPVTPTSVKVRPVFDDLNLETEASDEDCFSPGSERIRAQRSNDIHDSGKENRSSLYQFAFNSPSQVFKRLVSPAKLSKVDQIPIFKQLCGGYTRLYRTTERQDAQIADLTEKCYRAQRELLVAKSQHLEVQNMLKAELKHQKCDDCDSLEEQLRKEKLRTKTLSLVLSSARAKENSMKQKQQAFEAEKRDLEQKSQAYLQESRDLKQQLAFVQAQLTQAQASASDSDSSSDSDSDSDKACDSDKSAGDELRTQLKQSAQNLSKVEAQLKKAKADLKLSELQLTAARSQVDAVQAKLKTAEAKLTASRAQVDALRDSTLQEQSKLSDVNAKLGMLRHEFSAQKCELSAAKERFEAQKSEVNALRKELADHLKTSAAEVNALKDQHATEIDSLEQKVQSVKREHTAELDALHDQHRQQLAAQEQDFAAKAANRRKLTERMLDDIRGTLRMRCEKLETELAQARKKNEVDICALKSELRSQEEQLLFMEGRMEEEKLAAESAVKRAASTNNTSSSNVSFTTRRTVTSTPQSAESKAQSREAGKPTQSISRDSAVLKSSSAAAVRNGTNGLPVGRTTVRNHTPLSSVRTVHTTTSQASKPRHVRSTPIAGQKPVQRRASESKTMEKPATLSNPLRRNSANLGSKAAAVKVFPKLTVDVSNAVSNNSNVGSSGPVVTGSSRIASSLFPSTTNVLTPKNNNNSSSNNSNSNGSNNSNNSNNNNNNSNSNNNNSSSSVPMTPTSFINSGRRLPVSTDTHTRPVYRNPLARTDHSSTHLPTHRGSSGQQSYSVMTYPPRGVSRTALKDIIDQGTAVEGSLPHYPVHRSGHKPMRPTSKPHLGLHTKHAPTRPKRPSIDLRQVIAKSPQFRRPSAHVRGTARKSVGFMPSRQ